MLKVITFNISPDVESVVYKNEEDGKVYEIKLNQLYRVDHFAYNLANEIMAARGRGQTNNRTDLDERFTALAVQIISRSSECPDEDED